MTRLLTENSCVLQLQRCGDFERYEPQLAAMMRMYGERWGERPGYTLGESLENLCGSLPHVWLGLCHNQPVCAATLTDEVPGRHAYLHGVHHPAYSGHGVIHQTAVTVFRYAFETLDVLKVKAECLPQHWGARGFCRRYGFRLEARLPEDRCVGDEAGGQVLSDVLLYALSRDAYGNKSGGGLYVDGKQEK